MPSPAKVAAEIAAEAPDREWLRDVTRELFRKLDIPSIERIQLLWGLSAAETGRLFGVSRQAFARWLTGGIPPSRAAAVADLVAANDVLCRHLKPERIAAVVRRPAPVLDGRSLLEMAAAGRHREVNAAVRAMFDIRRIQP